MKKNKYRFSIVIEKSDDTWETLATPMAVLDEKDLNKIKKVNIYEGEEGQELFVKSLEIK